jgi:GntR family transcriptional repressor for pyruvate dehydrogenase complex
MLDAAFLSDETQQDLYEMRLILEIGLAESLFMHKTDQGLEALKSVVKRTENASNEKTRIKLDAEFHRTLYEIVGNKLLYKFQSLLEPFFKTAADREKQGESKKSKITHRKLLEELDSGTPESFRKAMKEHLAPHYKAMETNK